MVALVYAFVAGFVSTLLFHQGVLWVLHKQGLMPKPPWDMTPVPPLRVPSVVSLALWGGLWGVVLWLLIRGQVGAMYWTWALVLGAVLPTLVALLVVFPLKGQKFAAGWDPKIWIGALLVNGAWAFGVALMMMLAARLVY
jgi:hypothetical protein